MKEREAIETETETEIAPGTEREGVAQGLGERRIGTETEIESDIKTENETELLIVGGLVLLMTVITPVLTETEPIEPTESGIVARVGGNKVRVRVFRV